MDFSEAIEHTIVLTLLREFVANVLYCTGLREFMLRLSISPQSKGATLSVESCKVSVSKFSDDHEVSYPDEISAKEALVLKKTATLKVMLSMKTTSKGGDAASGPSEKLDQVMLILEQVGGGTREEETANLVRTAAVYVGKLEESNASEGGNMYSYTIQANPKKLVKMLKGREGEYSMTLVLGDKAVSNPIEWKIGIVNIQMEITGSREERKKAAQILRPMTTLKPEIHHTFQEGAKHAPTFVSYAFVVATFSSIPLLVVMLTMTSSTSFEAFPKTVAGVASSLFFHASCLLMLYVLLQFFMRQYIFEILPSIVGVGILTTIAGYKLLSHLATARRAAEGHARVKGD